VASPGRRPAEMLLVPLVPLVPLPAQPQSRLRRRGCGCSVVRGASFKQSTVKHRAFGDLNSSCRAPGGVELGSFPAHPARHGRGCGAGGTWPWCPRRCRERLLGTGGGQGQRTRLCVCGFMNFAAVLGGEAAPARGTARGQRGAGPGAAARCACPPGHQLPRPSAPRAAPSGRAAGPGDCQCHRSVRLSVCRRVGCQVPSP